MRRKVFSAAAVIIALLIVGFFYVRSTPHYSLYMLKRAVENHNPDEALKYINIDSIVDNLARALLGKQEGDGTQKVNGKSSLKMMVTDALPDIKESIRLSFREAIASHGKSRQKAGSEKAGSNNEATNKLSRNRPKDATQKKTPVQYFNKSSFSIGEVEIGNLDIRKIGETSLWDLVVRMNGKTAVVFLKNTPNIRAKMVKTDAGYWQIVEVILS